MAHVHRNWNTPVNLVKSAEAAGKPVRLVAGSWIADLCALRKAVMLCEGKCTRRWNAEAYGYERVKPCMNHTTANGQCDGCGDGRLWPVACAMYLPKG